MGGSLWPFLLQKMGRQYQFFWLYDIIGVVKIFGKADDIPIAQKGEFAMFPTINKKQTGINLRKIMDARGLTVKDIQQYLGLGSVQSIYHWLNGISMPTIDNLYALSELFQMSIDDMLCGNRRYIPMDTKQAQYQRLLAYYDKMKESRAA